MQNRLRPAIAMIELIFALVVMGIALMSAPLILNMSIQSSSIAMQQESISAVASELSLILTHPWDEGDTNSTTGHGILRVSNGDADLGEGTRKIFSRKFNTALHRQNASPPATFGRGNDGIPNNDIDDFDNVARGLRLYSGGEQSSLANNEGEYLKGKQFTLTTNILYGNDEATYTASSVQFNAPFKPATPATTSNIKLIRVVLTDDTGVAEHDQVVSLYGFACNIGNASFAPVKMD